MKKILLVTVFSIITLNLKAQSKKYSYPKKNKEETTLNLLMRKMNLSFALKGEVFPSIGNVFIFGWNILVSGDKKDENGERILVDGKPVPICAGCEIDFIQNNGGGEIKLDYYLTPGIVISGGINSTGYDKYYFGENINHKGYFFETQLKPDLNSNFYFFGQVGRTKSIFLQNDEIIKHAQYATGFGVGNDYYGFDIGANFFGASNEMKQKLLENTTVTNIQKSYLESVRVMLRLTIKVF